MLHMSEPMLIAFIGFLAAIDGAILKGIFDAKTDEETAGRIFSLFVVSVVGAILIITNNTSTTPSQALTPNTNAAPNTQAQVTVNATSRPTIAIPTNTPPPTVPPTAIQQVSIARAQNAESVSFHMNPVEGSQVSGVVTLTQNGNSVIVAVVLEGLDPYSAHAGHIHEGSCEAQNKVDFLLTSIQADSRGHGSAETNVEHVTYRDLVNGRYYVQYHISDNPPGRQISCSNLIIK